MEYRQESEVKQLIEDAFADAECTIRRARRLDVRLPADRLTEFASRMQLMWDFPHLSAISCVDWIEEAEFELVYHFWSYNRKILVSARIRIPRTEDAHFDTITHLWQPAKFFERDIHEMFGVVFDGNEDLERFILTDWTGPPPMRKDFITREYAMNHFHFRDYHPQWLEELKKAGRSDG